MDLLTLRGFWKLFSNKQNEEILIGIFLKLF